MSTGEFLTRLGQFEHLTPDERRRGLAARTEALGRVALDEVAHP